MNDDVGRAKSRHGSRNFSTVDCVTMGIHYASGWPDADDIELGNSNHASAASGLKSPAMPRLPRVHPQVFLESLRISERRNVYRCSRCFLGFLAPPFTAPATGV